MGLTHELTNVRVSTKSRIVSAWSLLPYASTIWVAWNGTQATVNVVAIVMHIPDTTKRKYARDDANGSRLDWSRDEMLVSLLISTVWYRSPYRR